MKRRFLLFFFAAIAPMLYCGCEKAKTYSDIPAIQFVSLTKERGVLIPDSNSIITISFTDGDGDIGYYSSGNGSLFDSDSLNGIPNIYYHDFIVSYFHKVNGVWTQDTSSVVSYSARLPYLTPTGNNKALSGDISMTQDIWTFPVKNDTIHYQVYIYDRALHKSNTITTSDIVINTVY